MRLPTTLGARLPRCNAPSATPVVTGHALLPTMVSSLPQRTRVFTTCGECIFPRFGLEAVGRSVWVHFPALSTQPTPTTVRPASMIGCVSTSRFLAPTRCRRSLENPRQTRCVALGERPLKPPNPEQTARCKASIQEVLFRHLLCASALLMLRPRAGALLRCRLILCRFGEALPLKTRARSSASELLPPWLAVLSLLRVDSMLRCGALGRRQCGLEIRYRLADLHQAHLRELSVTETSLEQGSQFTETAKSTWARFSALLQRLALTTKAFDSAAGAS